MLLELYINNTAKRMNEQKSLLKQNEQQFE